MKLKAAIDYQRLEIEALRRLKLYEQYYKEATNNTSKNKYKAKTTAISDFLGWIRKEL